MDSRIQLSMRTYDYLFILVPFGPLFQFGDTSECLKSKWWFLLERGKTITEQVIDVMGLLCYGHFKSEQM